MVELRIGDESLTLSWDEWEARVRSGRVPPTALVRFEPATGDAWVPAGQLELYQSLRNDDAIAWRGQFSDSPPLLTALLVGVQIKLWWLAFWTPEFARWMVRDLTLFTPAILENAQVWRVISMGFAHRATDHLAMNMLWLAYCGWNIERALGRRNLLAIYLGSVVFGALLSMFGDPGTPSLGASGGVFGLVGASIVFGFARPHLLPERGRRLFGWALVPYLVIMFGSGLASEGTDNWSHFGGLIAGVVLGVLLDPPPLQRRRYWNSGWYGLIGGCTAFMLAFFALAGPSIYPVADSEIVRFSSRSRNAPSTSTDRALNWRVPVGWRPGRNSAGDAAFESPAGPRSWSVVERTENRPTSAEDTRATWIEKVRRAWPDAQIQSIEATTLADNRAVGALVILPTASQGPRLLAYRATARGLWTLQAVWEVEVERAHKLDPLRSRLFATTKWDNPQSFESAKIHFEHNPKILKARDAWATELARVGRVEEALEIRLVLTEERPEVAAYWSGLIDLISWYPEDVPDSEALWQAAMDAHPTGSMAAAVAESMDAVGESQDAIGLLDLAWNEIPGERSVRRSRKRRGLSLALVDALPWAVALDPISGEARSPESIDAILAPTATVANAKIRGAQLQSEREQTIAATAAAFESGELELALQHVAWFRYGTWEMEPDERLDLIEDLRAATTRDRPPRWIPADVLTAVRRVQLPEPSPAALAP